MAKKGRIEMTLLVFRLFTIGTALALLAPVSESRSEDSRPESIDVLIVDGFSNHNWQQTTRMVRRILADTDLFHVDVSTSPGSPNSPAWDTWHPRFADYDVVIQNTNNIGKSQIHWPRKVEVALEDYVKSGGGLYILHSANNAFSHWKEYDRMIGLGWRRKDVGTALEIKENGEIVCIPPGEGKGTSHGPRFDTVVKTLNRHAINKGFPERWKTPSLEVYVYARGPAENLTVLSYAFDKGTQKCWPIEWVVGYGEGRVYNSTFGHLWRDETEPASFRCVGFQTTLIRATEWLATKKVTWPVPSDFPTEDAISLRDEKMKDKRSHLPERTHNIMANSKPTPSADTPFRPE